LDAIGFSSRSAYKPKLSEGIQSEQGLSKSFKRALEEQDAKVPGDENSKPGETNTDVKEVTSPEAKEETAASSYDSAEQDGGAEENNDDQVPVTPVLAPLVTMTVMPESEANLGDADAALQGSYVLAVLETEESTKGETGPGNKADIGANILPEPLQTLTENKFLYNLNNLNTTIGTPVRGENIDASAVLPGMLSAMKEGKNADKKGAVSADSTTISMAKGGKGETLDISTLLVRYGGNTQDDLNSKNGQTGSAANNSLSPEDIAILKSGDKTAVSVSKDLQSETQSVDIRKSLNLVKPQQEQLTQGDLIKPADAQKIQLSAAFGQEDARSTLEHSGSKKLGDELNVSNLKGTVQVGAENSAGISTSETGKTDAKHPMQDVSTKIIEQVREPLVQAVKKGVDHIQLRLKPDGLGELRIDLRIHGGKLNMQIITDNVTTRHLLEFGLPELKGQLAGSGISVGNTNVEHNEGRGENKNQAGYKQDSQDQNNNKKGNQDFREYFA